MTFRPVNNYVCSRLRRLRNEKRWRLADVARRAAVPSGTYSVMEAGLCKISLEHLLRIQLALGVEISDLWPNPEGECSYATDDVVEAVVRAAQSRLPKQATNRDVVRAVCRVYEVSREELASPSRRRPLPEARAVAAWICEEEGHLRMVELAEMFNRKPSSLHHSRNQLLRKLPGNRRLLRRVLAASRLLRTGNRSPDGTAPARGEAGRGPPDEDLWFLTPTRQGRRPPAGRTG